MKGKLIWILNPYDALEGEVGFDRTQQLVRELNDGNYEVIWFNSVYSHALKRFRSVDMAQGGIVLLPTISYRSHTGFLRLLNGFLFSFSFLYYVLITRKKPDLLLSSGPVPFSFLSLAVLKFFKGTHICIELRDLWPEGSINITFANFRLLGRVLAGPFYFYRHLVFMIADSYVFLNITYQRWFAERYANLFVKRKSVISYPSPFNSIGSFELTCDEEAEFVFVFSGTLGASHDHELLFQALELKSFNNAVFYITGSGPYFDAYKRRAMRNKLNNVICTGYLSDEQYRGILKISDVGIALYKAGSPVSMPTKVIDYINNGLALIVSSVNMEAADLIRTDNLGFVVEDVQSLLRSIDTLVSDPHYVKNYKANTVKARPRFTPINQITAIKDLIYGSINR